MAGLLEKQAQDLLGETQTSVPVKTGAESLEASSRALISLRSRVSFWHDHLVGSIMLDYIRYFKSIMDTTEARMESSAVLQTRGRDVARDPCLVFVCVYYG